MAEVVGDVAPETPVAAPEATPAPSSPENKGNAPPVEAEPEKPEKTYSQKDFEEAISKRLVKESRRLERIAQAEARAELAERQLAEIREQRQPSGADKEPNPQDFKNDYEGYILAKAQHAMRQELEALRSQFSEETAAQEQQRQALREAEVIKQSIADAPKKYADFNEVALDPDLNVTPVMGKAIAKSGVAPDLLYYLGSNREEAERIANLDPVDQVLEIAQLKLKLAGSPAPTKVPAPITPNKTSGKVESGYRPDMTDKEFAEWRRRSIAQKR